MPRAAETETGADSILDVVARRISSLRALRGVSRKILAERSRVSVRHLAQIEQGSGNVSIKLLEQISEALGVAPADLVTDAESTERDVLTELISTLSVEDCRAAEALIRRELLQGGTDHREKITLVGLRGAGKTTLGRLLAKETGVVFVSITQRIEASAGMRVSEINSLSGQSGYRRYEQQAVTEAVNGPAAVIEAGGSIVANAQAYAELLSKSYVVWVQTSPQEHMRRVIEQGDLRPMEGRNDAMDDLVAMLEERSPMYARAHATLDTSGRDPKVSIEELKTIAGLRTEAA